MTIENIQTQALQLPLNERWHLIQSLLISIQQETQTSPVANLSNHDDLATQNLEPWTKSLIGVVELPESFT